jgi:ABC-type amino acid transport substrate-binding protein
MKTIARIQLPSEIAMPSMRCLTTLALSVLSIALAAASPAMADVLSDIGEAKKIRLAVREDAPPFSSKGPDGATSGYSVALCQAVAAEIGQQLKISDLAIEYVTVTAADRFDAISGGKADLLCEATTATLERREVVNFSIPTFISGASIVIRENGPKDIAALKGQRIGVLAGTTTEEGLHATLKQQNITADVVLAKTHDEGLDQIDKGDTVAYFADRTILMYLLSQRATATKLVLADNYLTVEPYALALPRGDDDFRLAVDRALSHLYRSGKVGKIFNDAFGNAAKPTNLQRNLFRISGLPD